MPDVSPDTPLIPQISPLTGRLPDLGRELPALQWLDLGFAIHPLLPNSKAWVANVPNHELSHVRTLTRSARSDAILNKPSIWRRIGVEPASIHAKVNFVVVDDDSHKEKYTAHQRSQAQYALDLLMPTGRMNIPQETTPSGGVHYYLRNPDDIEIANEGLVGIDILTNHNVACWPTEGYEFTVPFPSDLSTSPAIDRSALNAVVKLLKPAHNLKRDAMSIRASGRNNHARNVLWNCCMTSLRTYPNEDEARKFAGELYEERLKEMSILLGGENPLDWGVHPDRDFERTWPNALAAKVEQDDLGVMFDQGYLRAFGAMSKKDNKIPMNLIMGEISAIWRCHVYAGPPSGSPKIGVKVEMVDGTTAFLPNSETTFQQISKNMNGIHFHGVPNAQYSDLLWQSHQAVQIGLQLSAAGDSWALPTGIWWRNEFDPDIRPRLPPDPWSFYGGGGVLSPSTGELDESIPVTPVTADQIFSNEHLSGSVPWKLGPRSNPAEVSAFCRTMTGFQLPHVAAQACALSTLGLMRGLYRGSHVIGRAQPFVSVEGPAGSGKSHGIFAAAYALAGAKTGLRSEAFYAVEMTQSRCATLVLDDVTLGPEWAQPLLLQQTEQPWAKTNSIRQLLGLTVISSQGFNLPNNDQALQDRMFLIDVPNIVKSRRSLIDPSKPQSVDLEQISFDRAAKYQGEFTRLVVRACGMIPDIDEAARGILAFWETQKVHSQRRQLIYVSVELSLRAFVWVARGCNKDERWWETDQTTFPLDNGEMIDLVKELRYPPGDLFGSLAELRRQAAPLAMAVREYLTECPMVNLGDAKRAEIAPEWFRHYALWIIDKRLCIRVATLQRWCDSHRGWPTGAREKVTFTTRQFNDDLTQLGDPDRVLDVGEKPDVSAPQNDRGIWFRRLSPKLTRSFLLETCGYDIESAEVIPDPLPGMANAPEDDD